MIPHFFAMMCVLDFLLGLKDATYTGAWARYLDQVIYLILKSCILFTGAKPAPTLYDAFNSFIHHRAEASLEAIEKYIPQLETSLGNEAPDNYTGDKIDAPARDQNSLVEASPDINAMPLPTPTPDPTLESEGESDSQNSTDSGSKVRSGLKMGKQEDLVITSKSKDLPVSPQDPAGVISEGGLESPTLPTESKLPEATVTARHLTRYSARSRQLDQHMMKGMIP